MPGSELIQSVVRAAEIIRLVGASPDGVGLAELAERLGLKSPTVHHLVRTLVETGMLEKLTSPIRYRIGPALRGIAATQSGRNLHTAAAAVMQQMEKDLGNANIVLAEFVNNDVAVTLRMSVDQPGVIQRSAHQSLAAYSSASTLLFQALWSSQTRENYRQRYPFEDYHGTWTDIATLDAFLKKAAKERIVIRLTTDETRMAVAAPICDEDGRLIATIGASVISPSGTVPQATREKLIARVKAAALQIGQDIQ